MTKAQDDARAEIMREFPNMDMKAVAAGLRSGEIQLSVPADKRSPEVDAWLRDCAKAMADVLDPAN